MTDKKYKAFKKRTTAKFHEWLKVFGLDNTWHVTLHFYRGGFDENEVSMLCEPDWKYLHAEVRVNVPQNIWRSPDEVEYAMVHELVHILLAGQQQHPSDEMHEHTTSQITNAFKRLKRELA